MLFITAGVCCWAAFHVTSDWALWSIRIPVMIVGGGLCAVWQIDSERS